MFQKLIFVIFSISALAGAEETRKWSNADGTKHFKASFVSRSKNHITLRLEDGKELTFDIAKLHSDDQLWLNRDPSPKQPEKQAEPVIPENAVFDSLCFGDDRKTVTKKLQASKIVKSNLSGEFFGRTGLNGVFETREKVAGLNCSLYFDWDTDDKLIEITLRSDSTTATEYDTLLKPCWVDFANIVTQLHGQPQMRMEIPKHSELTDKEITITHFWEMEHGGNILLGTSRMGDTYQVNVRFTKAEVE
jgi:hypothetical protein